MHRTTDASREGWEKEGSWHPIRICTRIKGGCASPLATIKPFFSFVSPNLERISFGTNGYRKCRLFPAFTSHRFRLQQDTEPNRPQWKPKKHLEYKYVLL